MDPCHHGMACSQAADGVTAANMEGSCEYIEQAVAGSRQEVVLQLAVLGEALTTSHGKNALFYGTLKWDVGVWAGSSWLRIGTGGGKLIGGDEPSGSIKCGGFLG